MHPCCPRQPPTSASHGDVWPSPCRRASHAVAGGRTKRQWPAGRCQRGHQSLCQRSLRQKCRHRRRRRRRRLAPLQQRRHKPSLLPLRRTWQLNIWHAQLVVLLQALQHSNDTTSPPGITVLDAVEKASALLTVAAVAPFALDWQLPHPRLAVSAGVAVFPVCRSPVLANNTPLSPYRPPPASACSGTG